MSSPDIKTLSTRIDSLVELAERDDLQKKNELAKARVEAIILRLKALEAQDQEQD